MLDINILDINNYSTKLMKRFVALGLINPLDASVMKWEAILAGKEISRKDHCGLCVVHSLSRCSECPAGFYTTCVAGRTPEEELEFLRKLQNISLQTLRGTNLSGADLHEVKLTRVDLSGADLSKADLSKATLHKATLALTNLTKANLVGADFRGADLTRANLTGAILNGADFHGADLTDVIGFEGKV